MIRNFTFCLFASVREELSTKFFAGKESYCVWQKTALCLSFVAPEPPTPPPSPQKPVLPFKIIELPFINNLSSSRTEWQ